MTVPRVQLTRDVTRNAHTRGRRRRVGAGQRRPRNRRLVVVVAGRGALARPRLRPALRVAEGNVLHEGGE